MFILQSNPQDPNAQVTTEQYLAKIKELETEKQGLLNKNQEYEYAYNQKVAQLNEYNQKIMTYEEQLQARQAGNDPNQGQAAPFATDDSVRAIIREEQEARDRKAALDQTKLFLSQHLKQKFVPAAPNVQMDTLLQKSLWQADLIMDDRAFRAAHRGKTDAEMYVIAFDAATAGAILPIVNNGQQNGQQIFNKDVGTTSDYGNAGGGGTGGTGPQRLADLERRRKELLDLTREGKKIDNQGKLITDSEILSLDFQINQEYRKINGPGVM